jgi:hypothetical protein
MKMVDEDCGVVPYNALVMTPANVLVKNTTFSGPKFIDELDSYCHLFKGYHEAPISKDLPGNSLFFLFIFFTILISQSCTILNHRHVISQSKTFLNHRYVISQF